MGIEDGIIGEREVLASGEELPMPPWSVNEEVTVYSMNNRKSGQDPKEYPGVVTDIGPLKKTIIGKNRGKRYRKIAVTYKVKYAIRTRTQQVWLKWFEGNTFARNDEDYWIESSESDNDPILIG